MAIKSFCALICLALAGCGTVAPDVVVRNVPVPTPCVEPVPERPSMPTESLRPGADLFVFATHAQAEIEVREAYEVRLLKALQACR